MSKLFFLGPEPFYIYIYKSFISPLPIFKIPDLEKMTHPTVDPNFSILSNDHPEDQCHFKHYPILLQGSKIRVLTNSLKKYSKSPVHYVSITQVNQLGKGYHHTT